MGQLYMQKFEHLSAVSKTEFDQVWSVALQTFAKTGNRGGVETGVRHITTYGTSWGGNVLIEADDPEAFGRYQTYHYQTYSYFARVTFEPLTDLDAMFTPVLANIRSKAK